MATFEIAHVLREGYAWCVFSKRVPAKWPKGHTWVHKADELFDPTQFQKVQKKKVCLCVTCFLLEQRYLRILAGSGNPPPQLF